jgi:two-component system response regulator PilR (NtrC family)
VRELENVVERAVALASGDLVQVAQLPESMSGLAAAAEPAPRLAEGFDLDAYLSGVEADLLHKAMEEAAGDRALAARLLGVTPRSLRYLIGKHGMGSAS